MRHYPAFLDLSDARCLVVGLGAVGRRKLAALAACDPAEVLALDAHADPGHEELGPLIRQPCVRFERRAFATADLDGVRLAFAATSDAEENARIAGLARAAGIPVNVADAPDLGDFIVPASFELSGLTVALSTHGLSPALARKLRKELQEHLGSRYERLLALLGALRPMVLELNLPQGENAALFRAVADSELAEVLGPRFGPCSGPCSGPGAGPGDGPDPDGDRDRAEAILRDILPKALHPRIGDLIDACD